MTDAPKIRFKEFTDEWEECKLGEIADVTKLAGFEFTEHVVYSDEGNIIALRGLNIKNGQLLLDDVKYIDDSNFAKLNRSKLYINDIMFTYVGTVGEVAIIKENDRFYLAPNVSRIRIESDDSPEYISQYMRTELFYKKIIFPLIATSSQPALSMENIRKFIIYLPKCKEEQCQIAECLGNIDDLITLHQRKCDETKELKKYMLQKMFPRNGKKNPEIRFAGFTDDWEQRKLREVCLRVQGNDGRMELPTLTISAGNGWMKQEDRFSGNIAGKEQKNYTLLHKGELSYNHGNSKLAKYGAVFSLQTYEEALVPRVYHSFKVRKGNADFVEYYFATKLPDRELGKLISSGARMDGLLNIGYDEFMGIPLMVPSIEEQMKISIYFRHLDHLITLHQRKCDELKEVKKFMLKNMFPQKG